jgi:hypothetical protein
MANKNTYRVGIGEAPNWADVTLDHPNHRSFYMNSLNWASMALEDKELKEETIKWLKLNGHPIDKIILLDDKYFITAGKICWILNTGGVITEESRTFLYTQLNKVTKRADDAYIQSQLNDNEISPDRTPFTFYMYAYNDLDDLQATGVWDEENILSVLRKYPLSASSLDLLRTKYRTAMDEIAQARKEYKEYFEKVSDQELDLNRRFYKQILLLIDHFSANKKARRKPRKQNSSKKTERAVKNVKFKKEDNTYKLVSIDPSTMVGSAAAIVFNSKSRRIGIYLAEEGKTLSIKGTTIQNYDLEKSKSKILRKPEEQLNHFRTANLKRAEVLLEYVAGKSHELNGRLNEDTVLLKKF